MIRFMREIETKYDVSSVTVNNIQVWPFLRTRYYCKYSDKIYGNIIKEGIFSKIRRARHIFYGFKNIFRKYDYFIFSDRSEKRLKNNIYIDILVDDLIKELGEDSTLLIEDTHNDIHINIKRMPYRNIVSSNLIHFFSEQYYLYNKKLLIYNESILKGINEKYTLNIDYRREILRFLNYVRYYKIIFNIYKPKSIFISSYYALSRQSAIYTANKMGIKTVELQHGIINNAHFAYNIFCKLDNKFFPNYLLSFGDYVENIFTKDNYFISKKNIFPVGNSYLEYIKNTFKDDSYFLAMRKKYKKIVAVPLQYTTESKLIKFIKYAAIRDNSILYILIPRDFKINYSTKGFPKNLVIIKKYNFHKVVKYADFHVTVFSTCALEAPALGTPNILINIDKLAEEYYRDLLTNRDVTRFVDNEKEFIALILNWQTKSREVIMYLHRNFYKPNHRKNINNALKRILNSSKSS